jgi:sigma-B regulation protein RsbU (phosphoserine phosphatase)
MNPESRSILIVDDEELNSEGLARRLQRHGYVVTVVKSGREAIELLGQRRFDLVLLDIMMPGMNGLDVLKFLRRVDSRLELPIIMVTAKGESEDIVEALELGANDYVTKPLDLPVVLARIRTQLALRRAVAQITELEHKLDARTNELDTLTAERAGVIENLRRDLEEAARVQRAFLPAPPGAILGLRLAWVFQPCGTLAGNFPNIWRPDDQHLGLCILDAGGRGVAAALLAMTAGQLLARLCGVPPAPPGQVVGRLSEQLCGEAIGQCFTLLYGILDLQTRVFRFVSAGHSGPVHLPQGARPALREAAGLPVGVGTAGYLEEVVRLRPGDRLVLYSDGLTEARNADGEHFGTTRLVGTLEQTRPVPLQQSLTALVQTVERWCGDNPRKDDFSILAVEVMDQGTARAEAAAAPA